MAIPTVLSIPVDFLLFGAILVGIALFHHHTLAIAVLGVPLVDNAFLEDAARESASRKRWEFLTTVHFTRLRGGTASNFNALATY